MSLLPLCTYWFSMSPSTNILTISFLQNLFWAYMLFFSFFSSVDHYLCLKSTLRTIIKLETCHCYNTIQQQLSWKISASQIFRLEYFVFIRVIIPLLLLSIFHSQSPWLQCAMQGFLLHYSQELLIILLNYLFLTICLSNSNIFLRMASIKLKT